LTVDIGRRTSDAKGKLIRKAKIGTFLGLLGSIIGLLLKIFKILKIIILY